MKNLAFILLLLAVVPVALAQKHPKIIPDPKNQKPMIVGKCSRASLEKGEFKEWFDKEYNDYQVDKKILDLLNGQWRDIKIIIIMGTWCSDSKREVPRFYKILDYVKFKKKNLKVICVDRDKKAREVDVSQYKMQYVPTIIIYRGGSEMGRIVENPAETLEKDLYKFVGLAEKR